MRSAVPDNLAMYLGKAVSPPGLCELLSLLVSGSTARDTAAQNSDLDLVVLHREPHALHARELRDFLIETLEEERASR